MSAPLSVELPGYWRDAGLKCFLVLCDEPRRIYKLVLRWTYL